LRPAGLRFLLAMNGALPVVPAGSLDSTLRLRPDAHIFFSSRANWDEALAQIPARSDF
jgi:hypothetical protein